MKVLKSHDFGTRGFGAQKKYDWDVLCDGQIRQLDPEDFEGATDKTFRQMMYKQSLARGKSARVAAGEDGALIVQAVEMTEEEVAARQARAEARAAEKAQENGEGDEGGELPSGETEPARKKRGKKS